MSEACGFSGEEIMFSSNDTPPEEFAYAAKLGAIINLDDFTHIQFLEDTLGYIPETISCRFNPGGVFKISNDIMDNPGDSKYGMTTEQIFEAFKILKAKGAKRFGIHAFLASNTVTNEYYPLLARQLFELAVKLKEETGGVRRLYQPVRRHRHPLPPRPGAKRYPGDWGGRAERLPGRAGARRYGRRGAVHGAGPLYAGALRLSGDQGDP